MTPNAISLYAQPSPNHAAKRQALIHLLHQAAAAHPPDRESVQPRLALACSLGAEDLLLAHWVNQLALPVAIFVLDTGVLHEQTLQTLQQLVQRSKAPVGIFRPDSEAVAAFVSQHGTEAMYQSLALRQACCAVRKLQPLARALAGKTAWITGLRREQSDARAEVPTLDQDHIGGVARAKYNPLADWTWGDVWHAIATEGIAYHPLHDRFYTSIGCAPCTRAITLGEPFRAGRWWWENASAKECGLHVAPSTHLTPHTGSTAP